MPTPTSFASDLAATAARSVCAASRLWNFRGLGTMFKAAQSVPFLPAFPRTVEFEPGCRFETEVFEPYWGPVIVGRRPYEPDVHHIVDRLLRSDVTWIDGGANLGYWSIIASGPRFGARRVVAIEPNPTTFAKLQRNWQLNRKRFRCEQVALAAGDTQRGRLVWTDQHAIARVAGPGETLPGIEVDLLSIDQLVERLGWDDGAPCLVKLDVEGNEVPAIVGAAKLRARCDHALIFEAWPSEDFGVAAKVFALGYRIHRVTESGSCRELHASELPELARRVKREGPYHPENFVATARDGRFREELVRWASRR